MKKIVIATLAGLVIAGSWGANRAQAMGDVQMAPKAMSLGTVQIPHKVLADGKPLAAGSYTLHLTTESGSPVVGETPDSERWVEFRQGTTVKGRELATVLTKADIKEMKKPLEPGVAVLSGDPTDKYLRIWIMQGSTSYVVHVILDK